MQDDDVLCNGIHMPRAWVMKIEESQLLTQFSIGGERLARVRFGEEPGQAEGQTRPSRNCHDCAVVVGQFHVFGCDAERCPACGEQMLGCDCELDFEDGDEAEDADD